MSSDKGDLAYVFDIDGVFLKGGSLIPNSKEAFQLVKKREVPYIFLTNSTGCNISKAKLLSKLIEVEITPQEVIMAQSPVAELFHPEHGKYRNKRCLIVSSNNGQGEKEFAKMIGCTNFTTCDEINSQFPNLDWMDRAKWPASVDTSARVDDDKFQPIECILLLGEPIGWERNVQITLDVILGRGHPNKRVDDYPLVKNEIPIIAANLDLCWKAAANMPRFGNGAFLLILETFYEKITGYKLTYEKLFGKPSHHTYEFCLKKLRELYPKRDIQTIIGIGDNPQSDIAGANNIKVKDGSHKWVSVLVETGVYQPSEAKHAEAHSDSSSSCSSSEDDSNYSSKNSSNEELESHKPNHAHRDFLDLSTEADMTFYDLHACVTELTSG